VKYIGLDVGSSSVKGAVLKLDPPSVGDVVRADFPNAVPGLPPRRHEVEPGEILAAVRGVLESLLSAASDAQGLFLCGQMAA
jgi:sugar (pentulose or hexulose) kinase